MLDLNTMRLFAKVVECGSFSAAARALGMPKSTLSRRIAALEADLSLRLLQRTTRALHLTEPGAVFYQHCRRVVAEGAEAERALSREQDAPRGLLRVTAPVELGYSMLGQVMAEYLAAYPEVDLQIDLSNRLVDLVAEGYDLALRAGRLEDSSLVARRLGDSRMMVCAAPSYLQQHPAPRAPAQLAGHACPLYGDPAAGAKQAVTLEFDAAPGEAAMVVSGHVRVTLTPRMSANSMAVLRDAALAGAGVAVVPESLCRAALRAGRLLPLLEQWQLPGGGMYAIYPSARHLTPKLRSFMELLDGRL